MASERITYAAGGIVWRRRPPSGSRPRARAGRSELEVLTIHRPSYDDWSFPKGKVDPGEELQTTAVREIREETGVQVRLGHPLRQMSYAFNGGTKSVAYWCARPVSPSDAAPFVPNKEVDEIRWVGRREARDLLTYDHDRQLLDAFAELEEQQAHRTRTLVVVRHGKAVPRSDELDDLDRPLTAVGAGQAQSLVPLLAAYGVRRVVSSPAVRCAQTVEPFAHSISTFLEIDDRLSEDTRASQVQRSVRSLMDRKKPVVLSTHRPTLPWVFDAIGVPVEELATGEAVVVHHRKGVVLATEKLS